MADALVMMSNPRPFQPSMSSPSLQRNTLGEGPKGIISRRRNTTVTTSPDQAIRLRSFLDLDKKAGAISKMKARSLISNPNNNNGNETFAPPGMPPPSTSPKSSSPRHATFAVSRRLGSSDSLPGVDHGSPRMAVGKMGNATFGQHPAPRKTSPRPPSHRVNQRMHSTHLGSSHGSGDNLSLFSRRIASSPSMSLLKRNNRSAGSIASMNSSVSSTSTNCSTVTGRKNQNMVQMAQRSNGASVKAVIAELQRICVVAQEERQLIQQQQQQKQGLPLELPLGGGEVHDDEEDDEFLPPVEAAALQRQEQQQQQEELTTPPPVEECIMLSQWAVDAYYKVLISKYTGIPAIVSALFTFPGCADIQAYGCSALKQMDNVPLIYQLGGLKAIVAALKNHPLSIHVQSEACEALQRLAPYVVQQQQQAPEMPLVRDEDAVQSFTPKASDDGQEAQTASIANISNSAGVEGGATTMLRSDTQGKSKDVILVDKAIPLLQHANEMYLTHHGRNAVHLCLQFLLPLASATAAAGVVSGASPSAPSKKSNPGGVTRKEKNTGEEDGPSPLNMEIST